MRFRWNVIICVWCCLLANPVAWPQSASRPGNDGKRGTLWYIPHTHWEGAVFKTREEYLDMGLPIVLRALNMLKRHPNYKFTLDQAAFVKPFLDRYPEEVATFRRENGAGTKQGCEPNHASGRTHCASRVTREWRR